MAASLLLRPGTLSTDIEVRTRLALGSGALQPIATEHRIVDDAGIRFAIRKVSSLARKGDEHRQRRSPDGPSRDPFLPYEEALFVAPVCTTHVALLNKFNVIDHHLLIVTRRFEPQEALLSDDDFLALAACLQEIDGLAFYNGGSAAGASQPHKHLQLVPLPLGEGPHAVPVEPLFDIVRRQPGHAAIPGFAFRHRFAWLGEALWADAARAAGSMAAVYRELLAAAGLRGLPGDGAPRQSAPYNLLVTRRWMLLVPRSRECFDALSINALAYAGALFVGSNEQFETLRRVGPMAVLRDVGVSGFGIAD
jgi:ATP adenylyltransferase